MIAVFPIILAASSIGVVIYALQRGDSTALMPAQIGPWDERDVDALARMLLIETSFRHDTDEMRGILQVAINRANNAGRPFRDAVDPDSPIFSWATGASWRNKYKNQAQTYPQYNPAKAFVRDYLQGNHPNRVGASVNMVHQDKMPLCGGPCGYNQASGGIHSSNSECYTCKNSRGRDCVSVPSGARRCLPGWMNEKNRTIYHVGEARFAAPKGRV